MRNVKIIMICPKKGVIIVKNFIFIKCISINNDINNKGYMLPTIYMRKAEIPVEKPNGSHHFVWEYSENMGCDSRRFNFSIFSGLFRRFGYNL